METAEEILTKHYMEKYTYPQDRIIAMQEFKKIALDAMEEYVEIKVKKISFSSMLADSATAINKWCIENLGEKVMEKTDEERRQLYHYFKVVKYLADNNVNLKIMQE